MFFQGSNTVPLRPSSTTSLRDCGPNFSHPWARLSHLDEWVGSLTPAAVGIGKMFHCNNIPGRSQPNPIHVAVVIGNEFGPNGEVCAAIVIGNGVRCNIPDRIQRNAVNAGVGMGNVLMLIRRRGRGYCI